MNFSLEEVHVAAAARIAKAARDAGVARLIHVSDNLASPTSESLYARTKAAGEAEVKSIFPEATIVRPCDLFGNEDRFLNRYGVMVRRWPKYVGMLATAPPGRLVQPLWVSDYASAITRLVEDDSTAGKTYHLGGAHQFTMQQIYDLVNYETVSATRVTTLPTPLLQRVLRVLQYSRKNIFSPEDDLLHATDNIVPLHATNTMSSLGIEMSTLQKRAVETLVRTGVCSLFVLIVLLCSASTAVPPSSTWWTGRRRPIVQLTKSLFLEISLERTGCVIK